MDPEKGFCVRRNLAIFLDTLYIYEQGSRAYVIYKLRVVGVMKINSKGSEVFIFHNSGHEEFIKLILLLFCFAQRPSFPCDTQKWESVVTRLNWKDLINSSAYWGFEITSSANWE